MGRKPCSVGENYDSSSHRKTNADERKEQASRLHERGTCGYAQESPTELQWMPITENEPISLPEEKMSKPYQFHTMQTLL
ncbi:hypothetical protein TNCV_3557941 [Trichonephila clavipes]|uniref:Uncharacterized protein n=1 Tax=Trichonephila clavipes TaxID=2585209 RepID=A0A8X6WDM7_TRICX|nr:hypothetical protein TNCV_3557941 [Trichonephila clavipes]